VNGDIYKGDWLNGKRHGTGTMLSPNGESKISQWKDGKEVSKK